MKAFHHTQQLVSTNNNIVSSSQQIVPTEPQNVIGENEYLENCPVAEVADGEVIFEND